MFFQIFVFLKFFLQHHIHKQIFNAFFTKLHLFFSQLNLNLIIELNFVKFKFHSKYLNSILNFKSIQFNSNCM